MKIGGSTGGDVRARLWNSREIEKSSSEFWHSMPPWIRCIKVWTWALHLLGRHSFCLSHSTSPFLWWVSWR
jgi:hypothetical protein